MFQKRLKLTVLIPCLNEQSTIGNVVRSSFNAIKKIKVSGEVLVIDNGSQDDSIRIAKMSGARVESCSKKGYGNALIFGIKQARGKYIVMLDADQSYQPSFIINLWDKLKEGNFKYDMVLGSRLRGNIEKGAMPFLHRFLGTPVLTLFLNFFFKTKTTDCNSGMRLFKKSAIQKVKLTCPGMEFVSEMVVKAGIMQLRLFEIPINYFKDKRGLTKSHMRTWRDGWRNLTLLLSYAPNYFFILPGIILLMIGSLLVFTQYKGPFISGPIYLDIHMMTLGVLLGFLGSSFTEMGLVLEKDAWSNGYKIGWLYKLIKQYFTLERGLILSFIIFGIGFLFDVGIVLKWINNNFRNINEVRKTMTAMYLIYLSFQLLFFSFFLSFIGKDRKGL